MRKTPYKVSQRNAHCGEGQMVAENAIIPWAECPVSCVLGGDHIDVIKQLHFEILQFGE